MLTRWHGDWRRPYHCPQDEPGRRDGKTPEAAPNERDRRVAGMCEDRVCIITGAGRGIGREYALMLAEQGAKVVVNDLGGARDGTSADAGPAHEVVEEIKGMGGEAIANGDDISDFDAAGRLIKSALDAF